MATDHPIGIMSLDEFCAQNPRVGLAFSGGCDSAYLLAALLDAGVEVRPYLVKSAFQMSFELQDAQDLAHELGVSIDVIDLDVLAQPEITANTNERCYHCKHFIFSSIRERMKKEGLSVLVDGTNASDDPARRPGFKALSELGVLSPLRLAGLTKADIRTLSESRGLFTAQKPNFSCLATQVGEGITLTEERLQSVADGMRENEWVLRTK